MPTFDECRFAPAEAAIRLGILEHTLNDLPPDYLTVPQAATYLGVCPNTIRTLIKNKSIPAVKVKSKWQIRRLDLDTYRTRPPVDREKIGNGLGLPIPQRRRKRKQAPAPVVGIDGEAIAKELGLPPAKPKNKNPKRKG